MTPLTKIIHVIIKIDDRVITNILLIIYYKHLLMI